MTDLRVVFVCWGNICRSPMVERVAERVAERMAEERSLSGKMLAIAPGATNLSLLSEYDPDAEPGSGIPDPWYGTPAGFYGTLEAIEAAIPGLLDHIREPQR